MAEIKKIKPSLPKGTRDFLPEEVARRNYIFDTIKSVFRKYGFQQIDTPAFERLETLTGKYGEEGDRLLFKILNSGDPFKDFSQDELIAFIKKSILATDVIAERTANDIHDKALDELVRYLEKNPNQGKARNEEVWESILAKHKIEYTKLVDKELAENNRKIAQKISEKGLRYDLTVPLARYVVQHNGEITFPFKRFHIAPVWRADRPQKGRYQEFYQCDADVIGSTSLLNEVELTLIYLEVFEKLKLKTIEIRVNNRKILEAISIYLGCQERLNELMVIIDKRDKIGLDGICEELGKQNFTLWQIEEVKKLLLINDIKDLKPLINHIEIGQNGINEVEYVLSNVDKCKPNSNAHFDINLARGLNYYTGIIWEASFGISIPGETVIIGSLGGGGRYDNLTEMFGGRDMSGVGISFGIERIYDVLEELDKFPRELGETTKVLFVHFDEASEAYAFEQLQKVRGADIASEIYPGKKKLDKQMNYANDKKIPYVVVIGGDEIASGKLTFKNMSTGEQEKLTIEEVINRLKPNN